MSSVHQVRRLSLLLPLLALSVTSLLVPARARAQAPRPFVEDTLSAIELAVGSPVEAAVSPRTGFVTFLSLAPHQQTLGKLPDTESAADRALAFLDDYGPAFGILGRESLALTRAEGADEVGMEHVRFQQISNGVPVTGGELTVHLRGSAVVAVNAKTVADLGLVATTPVVTAAEATILAASALAKGLGIVDAELSVPRLELLNKGHLGGRGFATSLAWFVEARKIDLREFLWIDAITGKPVLQFSQLTDILDRKIYDANDPGDGVFGNLPGVLVRVEGGTAVGGAAAADANAAYDFSGDTYNYYLTVHGRDSYDGAGSTLISSVRYCPSSGSCPYANAFWNGTQMVYGATYPLADDVDAHELTHAVTELSASLFYYMQSGALNESFSDIFGESVDLTNGADAPAARWLMGEDLPIGAIRNMMNPPAFGDPGRMTDVNCLDDYNDDKGGVHTNSGIPNHAYALMVDGGIYNGKTVTGIGLTKAAKIQYRALTRYLLSASDFLDDYLALKQSCRDLIDTAGITEANCTEVGNALDAVEMSMSWACIPPQATAPALCPAGQAPNMVYFEDMESLEGLPLCDVVPTGWCLNTPTSILGTFATSGVNSLWGYDRETAGFIWVSDGIAGTLPAGAKMQFNHSYGFENLYDWYYYDGGVIEYSTNGGSNWIDGGSKIIAGQTYGGTIECCENPLANRSAFVADSWGYTASQLDLSSLAGQPFSYRFYLGTDSAVDEYGWFVDDVRIYNCAACLANRVLDNAHNGTASLYKASGSITAGSGFTVGGIETVTLTAPEVRLSNNLMAIGNLTIGNATCP